MQREQQDRGMADTDLRRLVPRRAWEGHGAATGREPHAASYTYPNGFGIGERPGAAGGWTADASSRHELLATGARRASPVERYAAQHGWAFVALVAAAVAVLNACGWHSWAFPALAAPAGAVLLGGWAVELLNWRWWAFGALLCADAAFGHLLQCGAWVHAAVLLPLALLLLARTTSGMVGLA